MKTFKQRFTTVDGVRYSVTMPLNEWDMNFHFISDNNTDYLVDLQDVLDELQIDSANIENAIEFANRQVANGNKTFWWTFR